MRHLRVLIIEDSEDDAELIVHELLRAGYDLEYTQVASKEAMLACMRSASFDLILCDYKMPNFNGFEALKLWKELGSLQPFILVSGTIGEEATVESLKMGANDYVLKDNLAKLCPVVEHALQEVEETRRRISAEQALRTSEAQYRTLVSNLPSAVYRCKMDKDWTMVFVSNAIENIVGYPAEDFIENGARTYESLIVPEDRKQVRTEIERAIKNREAFKLEYRVQHLDGKIRWVKEKGVGIWDDSGHFSHLDGVLEDITQRKEMEEVLIRREEWFRAIFEESPIAINVFDADGKMVLANRACLNMFGVREVSDMRGLNLFSDPNTADWVKEQVKSDQQARYESAFDFSKVHRDALYATEKQGIMWLDAVLSPLKYGDARELHGYIVQMQDITPQKRAAEELKKTLELLKKTFESQMDSVLIFDASSPDKIIDVNQSSTRLFGYDKQELIGKTGAFLHPSDESFESFLQQLRESVLTGGFLRLETINLKRKDGSIFPAELTTVPLVDELGKRFGYVSVVRDVTSREEDERSRKDSQNLYLSTIESTADGVLVIGVDGRIMYLNSRFVEMWQVPNSVLDSQRMDVLFSHMNIFLTPKEVLLHKAQQLIGDCRVSSDTLDLKDGRVIESYSAPIMRDGFATARVWTFLDITKIRKAEESARLYLDLMGHDIRNRLQVITMSVELGRMSDNGKDLAGILDEIESAARVCAKIVSKVKQTENLEQAQLVDRSLTEAVRTCIEAIRSGIEEFRIEESLSSSEMNMKADRYLETLLMNLLENSIIHNTRSDKKVWIHLREENDGYLLSISDNGPGLSDERKETLFDAQRRFGGVGLHIAHHIAEKYGGHLSVLDRVSGKPSEGAEFQLWLPRSDSTAL